MDEYCFIEKNIIQKNDFVVFDNTQFSNINVLTEREWDELVQNRQLGKKNLNFEKILISLEYGISSQSRKKIWTFLSQSDNIALNHNKNLYYNLLEKKDVKIEKEIIKDIDRTLVALSKEDREQYHNKLYNILKAYALFDNKLGYAQGTSFIVLLLLRIMKNEIDTFWIFVAIMIDKNWRALFLPNTPRLIILLNQLILKLRQNNKELYEHFCNKNFLLQIPGCLSHYFSTIFSYCLHQFNFTLRIFDLFWVYEGDVVIDTLLLLMLLQKNKLMKMSCEELMMYLKDKIVDETISKYGMSKCIINKKVERKITENEGISI